MRDEPNVRTPRSISFARTEDDCKEVDRLKRKLEKASVDADESASHSGKKGKSKKCKKSVPEEGELVVHLVNEVKFCICLVVLVLHGSVIRGILVPVCVWVCMVTGLW